MERHNALPGKDACGSARATPMQDRQDQFTVKAFDCRPDGQIKLNALMQYLQETAACHAEQLGVGFVDMGDRNCFWVLANIRSGGGSAMDRQLIGPGPWHTRRYRSSSASAPAARLFRRQRGWCWTEQRPPQNLTRLDLHLPDAGPKALSTPLRRLKRAQQYGPAHALQVPFSALDFNGHVNNTEYVRWALDGLHRRLGRSVEIHAAQITYLAEAFEGDEVEVLVSERENGRFDVLERKSPNVGGTDLCLMAIAC
jgi:hypothetical protein